MIPPAAAPPRAPIPAPFSVVVRGVEQPINPIVRNRLTNVTNTRLITPPTEDRGRSFLSPTILPSVALDAHSLFLVDRSRPGSNRPAAGCSAASVPVPSAGRQSRRQQ